jgi:hypothetical protein
MKAISFENNIMTVVVFRFWKWRLLRRYKAVREFPPGHWDWLKMPNMIIVGTTMSFQLDAWRKEAEKNRQ